MAEGGLEVSSGGGIWRLTKGVSGVQEVCSSACAHVDGGKGGRHTGSTTIRTRHQIAVQLNTVGAVAYRQRRVLGADSSVKGCF